MERDSDQHNKPKVRQGEQTKKEQRQQPNKTKEHQQDLTTNALKFRNHPPFFISAPTLMAKHFEPLKWVVPGIIPEGLTLFAGPPKIGKSWLVLDLVNAVASGGRALGSLQVEQGAVLYLALEDSQRRLQDRLSKLLEGKNASELLDIATIDGGFPRLDQGGADWLEAWIDKNPRARLIVADTLAKIRPPLRQGSIYEQDYRAMEALLKIANERRVAIILVHHTKKGASADVLEEVSGSFGLTGGVDGVVILKRARGRAEATFMVTGRDVLEEEYVLDWNTSRTMWTLAGSAKKLVISDRTYAVG